MNAISILMTGRIMADVRNDRECNNNNNNNNLWE
jgi:hypothetical protein